MTIVNETEYTFGVTTQDAIYLAAIDAEVDEVSATLADMDPNDRVYFDFFDKEGNYIFSVNTDTDEIYHRDYLFLA